MEPFVSSTVQAVWRQYPKAREFANVAHGAARCSSFVGSASMFDSVASLAKRRIGAMIAQEVANTAWAFGTASQSDAMLFAALARAVERRLGASIAQALANTAWAFQRATQWDAMVLTSLARAMERRLGEFIIAQAIAITA